jgi:hypothetical protein
MWWGRASTSSPRGWTTTFSVHVALKYEHGQWYALARIAVESMVGRPFRSLALRLPLASESIYTLPPGLLRFAHWPDLAL